jgi:hypothetical protein
MAKKPSSKASKKPSSTSSNALLVVTTAHARLAVALIVMVAAVFAGYVVYQGYASTPEIASGRAGYCLDDHGNGTANGNLVDIWTCNGSAAQHWTFSGLYVKVNGKCLDAKGWGKTNGTIVDLWDCNGGANQQWKLLGSAQHTELMNVNAGLCLDDTGYGNSGTQLELYTCNGQSNQVWYAYSYTTSDNSGSSCPSGWHASASCAQTYANGQFSAHGWDPQWPVYLNGGPYTPYGQGWYTRFSCLKDLWIQESGWQWNALNGASGAYGIPQSLPASKMGSAGSDWHDNAYTQVRWGLGYIKSTYGDPCAALQHEMNHNWY